jgi:hypothetical protein
MYSPKKIAFMSILKNVKHQTAICSFMKTVHTENDGKFCFRCNFYNFVIIDSEHRELYSNMGHAHATHNLPNDEIEILSSGS